MLLRWSAPLDLAQLAIRGWVEPVGPLVEAAADVLITLARSEDGVSMQLAIEPAVVGGECEATLHFSRLSPGTHRLEGRASGHRDRSRAPMHDLMPSRSMPTPTATGRSP